MPSATVPGTWSGYRGAKHLNRAADGTLYLAYGHGNTLEIYRSTDNGATWTQLATRAVTGPVIGFYSHLDGDSLYTTWIAGTVTREASTYTISTNTWEDGTGVTGGTSITGTSHIATASRSTGRVVLFQTATAAVQMVNYRRVAMRRPGAGAALNTNDAVHYDAYGSVLGSSDRVHMFYTGFDGTTRTLRMRTLTSANTIIAEQTIVTVQHSNYPVGAPASDGTTIIVPYVDTSGNLVAAVATSADSPVWTTGVAISGTGNGPETANANPATLAYDGTNFKAAWINDAQTSILTDTTSGGTTWGTEATAITGTGPFNGENLAAASTGLYILYDNNGTVTLEVPSTEAAPEAKSAPDTQVLASTDAATGALAATATDTHVLAHTDAATGAVAATATDTHLIGSTDAASVSSQTDKAAADTHTVAAADAATLIQSVTAADTHLVAATDTATAESTATTADAQAVTSTDAASSSTSASIIDTHALGNTDAATVAVASSANDTHAVTGTDSATASITELKSATDTHLVAATDVVTGAQTATTTDTHLVGSTSGAAVAVTSNVTDAAVLASTDTAIGDQSATASDTSTLITSDAASVSEQGNKDAVDSHIVVGTDAASVAIEDIKQATDTQIITGVDGVTLMVYTSATDTQSVVVSESVAGARTTTAADASLLVHADAAGLAVAMLAADSATLMSIDDASRSDVPVVYYPWPTSVTTTLVPDSPAVATGAVP